MYIQTTGRRLPTRKPAFIGMAMTAIKAAPMVINGVKAIAGLLGGDNSGKIKRENGELGLANDQMAHANDANALQDYNKRFNVDYYKGGALKRLPQIKAPNGLGETMKSTVGIMTASLVKSMMSNAPQSGKTPTVEPIGNNEVVVKGGAKKRDGINLDAPNGEKAKVNTGEVIKVEPETGIMKVVSTAPELGNPAKQVKDGKKGFDQAFTEQEMKKDKTFAKSVGLRNGGTKELTMPYDEYVRRGVGTHDLSENAMPFPGLGLIGTAGRGLPAIAGKVAPMIRNVATKIKPTIGKIGSSVKEVPNKVFDWADANPKMFIGTSAGVVAGSAATTKYAFNTERDAISKGVTEPDASTTTASTPARNVRSLRFTQSGKSGTHDYDYEPNTTVPNSSPTFNGSVYNGENRNPNSEHYFSGAPANPAPIAKQIVNTPAVQPTIQPAVVQATQPATIVKPTPTVASRTNPIELGKAVFLANRADDGGLGGLDKTIKADVSKPEAATATAPVSSSTDKAIGMKSSEDAIQSTIANYADNKPKSFGEKIGGFFKDSDKVNDAVNLAAPIVSSIVAGRAANKLRTPDMAPQIPDEYVRTRVNVNPQIQASRRAMTGTMRENEGNTTSSVARVARNSKAMSDNAQRESEIYANRENMETQLEHNAASIRSRNHTYNSQIAAQHNVAAATMENQKIAMKAQATNSALASIAAYGRDRQARQDNIDIQGRTLATIAATSPEGSMDRMIQFGAATPESMVSYYNGITDPQQKAKVFKMFTPEQIVKYGIKR